jgi:hypothetical protein
LAVAGLSWAGSAWTAATLEIARRDLNTQDCGGVIGPRPNGTLTLGDVKRVLLVVAASFLLAWVIPAASGAAAWRRCPDQGELRTQKLGCAEANEVLRRFFGSGPKIKPGPSPSGWACRQRQGDHTSDGGDSFYVSCHATRHPRRRLHYVWGTGL